MRTQLMRVDVIQNPDYSYSSAKTEKQEIKTRVGKARAKKSKSKDAVDEDNAAKSDQDRPSPSAETPKASNNGTPLPDKEGSGLAQPFRLPNGQVVTPEPDDERRPAWGLTARELALPYAEDDDSTDDDTDMDVTV